MRGSEFLKHVSNNISKVIVGKEETIRLLLCALVADGHVLLEDVPGTGKTKLAKALSASINAEFNRIQFTPDLLPSDITGINIYNTQKNEFELRKGPIFTNILLADEINRATPRTQSGLLEAMEERQVTIDGVTYKPGEPFFVIATQNPVENSGTFPLPEAQLDRFIMKLSMKLPSREEELQIMDKYMAEDPLTSLVNSVTLKDLEAVRNESKYVFVHNCVREYMIDLIEKTRNREDITLGVSPRGTLALLRCVKANAYLDDRNYVTPDDVKFVAPYVLGHRLIKGYHQTQDGASIIQEILLGLNVPTEDYTK